MRFHCLHFLREHMALTSRSQRTTLSLWLHPRIARCQLVLYLFKELLCISLSFRLNVKVHSRWIWVQRWAKFKASLIDQRQFLWRDQEKQCRWCANFWLCSLFCINIVWNELKHAAGRASISDCFQRCQSILTDFYKGGLWEKTISNDFAKLSPFLYKVILCKNTSQREDTNYILVFTLHLGMAQIFTDLPKGSKGKSQKWQKHMLSVYFL